MKIYKLIAVLILLPLGLNLVGVWQLQRSVDNTQRLNEIQADLVHARPYLEKLARSPSALTRTIVSDPPTTPTIRCGFRLSWHFR
ncbi:hypothetical protein DND90_12750 [Pseudomonas syringae pv. maculicola]|nr:hypothetical protein DND90_12750 [Pseudomonas syringae pv. maculicola]